VDANRTVLVCCATTAVRSWTAQKDCQLVGIHSYNGLFLLSQDPALTAGAALAADQVIELTAMVPGRVNTSPGGYVPLNVFLPAGTQLWIAPNATTSLLGLFLADPQLV
jgi:hypothetical protein